MRRSPFDHRQDKQLGEALRATLSASDEATFVQRVVDAAGELQGRVYSDDSWLDVLSAWARPGLAAALVGSAAALAMWIVTPANETVSSSLPPDIAQVSEEIPEEFLSTQPPVLNQVLAMEFGNQ